MELPLWETVEKTSSQMVLTKMGWGIDTFPFKDYMWSGHFFFFWLQKNKKKEKNTQGTYLNNTTSH